MRQTVFRPFFMISAERTECSQVENAKRSVELSHALTDCGLSFSKCEGVYKGTKEVSFMVFGGETVKSELLALAEVYNQECILERTQDNSGYLVYPSGQVESIGQCVTLENGEGDHTKVTADNGEVKYFTFK